MKKFAVKMVNGIGLVNVLADSFTIDGGFFIFKEEDKNIAAFKAEDVQSITGSEMILTLNNTNNHAFDTNIYTTNENRIQRYNNNLNIS